MSDYDDESVKLCAKHEPVKYFHNTWKSTDCECCEKEFDSFELVRRHKRICPNNPNPSFPCRKPGCDHRSEGKANFDKHQSMHLREEAAIDRDFAHACVFCKKTFKKGWHRDRHQSQCKDNPEKLVIECDECDATFANIDSLKRHKRLNRCKKTKLQLGTSSGGQEE